jgi:hypothetical protein
MHATAEFLPEEEAHATGAEGALGRQEARRKMIAAIEHEGIESLSQQTKVRREKATDGSGKERGGWLWKQLAHDIQIDHDLFIRPSLPPSLPPFRSVKTGKPRRPPPVAGPRKKHAMTPVMPVVPNEKNSPSFPSTRV